MCNCSSCARRRTQLFKLKAGKHLANGHVRFRQLILVLRPRRRAGGEVGRYRGGGKARDGLEE